MIDSSVLSHYINILSFIGWFWNIFNLRYLVHFSCRDNNYRLLQILFLLWDMERKVNFSYTNFLLLVKIKGLLHLVVQAFMA